MLVYLVVGFVSVPFFSLFAFNNFETKNKKSESNENCRFRINVNKQKVKNKKKTRIHFLTLGISHMNHKLN
jgi:hypothetical protein